MMSFVLVTGSQGFIGSYLCQLLLDKGYNVLGIDNYSKYGKVIRGHDTHPNFEFYELDLIKNADKVELLVLAAKPQYIIHAAAKIGGISYFHKFASDLLSENLTMDSVIIGSAIKLHKKKSFLKRFVAMSSSMVYENANVYPTSEKHLLSIPPPSSTYGFSKLALEYQCKGANIQYGLPYVIIRPFNCVGVGENEAIGDTEELVGNVKMLMSHVLPDLIYRAMHLAPTEKMPILGSGDQVRHYTNGKDIAKGIIKAMENDSSECEDYNISSDQSTTVKDLAELVWKKIHGTELVFEHLEPFEYDVQVRSPDTTKARIQLNFEAEISLDESVDEVIAWMKKQYIGKV